MTLFYVSVILIESVWSDFHRRLVPAVFSSKTVQFSNYCCHYAAASAVMENRIW